MQKQFGHFFFRHTGPDPVSICRYLMGPETSSGRRICFGRSMIEMLGVLAIIGVISIGGISLYRRGIDTHKANSIFDDVNRFEFVISERVFRTPRGFIDKADFRPISGFDMTAYNEPELSSHHISVLSVPKSVCRIVLDKGEKDYVMFVNNLMFEGESNICNKDLNEMRFYFGDTSDLCSFPDTDAGQIACSDGCLCDGDNECKPDIYNPNYPLALAEESTVCCPKDNNIVACNGKCIEECGTGKTLDRKTCQCVCADSMKQLDENGNCVCKPDTSGIELSEDENGNCQCPSNKPYYFDEASGGPACCAAGESAVNGTCHRLYCEGTVCYLNGERCGEGCSTVTDDFGVQWAGKNCSIGVCYADDCPESTTLRYIEPYRPFVKWTDEPIYYCAVGEDNEKICYYRQKTTERVCAPKKGALSGAGGCGSVDANLKMKSGLCNADYCTENFTSLDSDVKYSRIYGQSYGCLFPNHNNIYCQPKSYKDVVSNGKTERVPDKWECFKNSVHNGSRGAFCNGCSTPSDCLNSCTTCAAGETSLTLDGIEYCCNDSKTLCHHGETYYFVNGTTKIRCGSGCNLTTGYCTSTGSCTTSGGSPSCHVKINGTDYTCPNGYECVYSGNESYGYGCRDKNYTAKNVFYVNYFSDLKCTVSKENASPVEKGTGCPALGGGCKYAFVPECAVSGYCPVTAAGYDMGTDSANPTCLCKYGDGTAASVTLYNGHYYCCPSGHTYVNGACGAN